MECDRAYAFHKLIYIASDQKEAHYAQIFKILALMADPMADRVQHIPVGKVTDLSPPIQKLALLSEILDFAKARVLAQPVYPKHFRLTKEPGETASVIGMTALKVMDMQVKR